MVNINASVADMKWRANLVTGDICFFDDGTSSTLGFIYFKNKESLSD